MNDSIRTSPAAQAASEAMYHQSLSGYPAEPRAGIRIEGCSACLTRDHRDHYDKPTKRPLLMCATCKTFTRHEQTIADPALWFCQRGCGATAKRWGERAPNGVML